MVSSSSSHPYYYKKGIRYSQALRLERICSDYGTFGKRNNDLEQWLLERGYNEKFLRPDIVWCEKPNVNAAK